ncbi:hypothetical protein QUB47_00520 [Microcoleus sp. AT9_B5]
MGEVELESKILGDSRLLSENKYPFLGGVSRSRYRTPPGASQ